MALGLAPVESWSGREPLEVPGRGPALSLFDTRTRAVRPTSPHGAARMYVCGITPYDATHMGHANTYVAFDLVNRYWRDLGLDVHYVQNVTDVDDPLLERAVATGQDWRELARAETALFAQDMTALNVLPPRDYVGAVESIPSFVRWIEVLREVGVVYEVAGDLYFQASGAPGFGEVSGLDEAQMTALFAERGGDPDRPGKRAPLDCLLWQAARPDEPAWDTVLGHGRPGWHIECTAIALDHLGMGFDVQGGGSDLAFPHHEMCAAQAGLATGDAPFAQHFVHAGMVGLDGHKMSKSRGNLIFISRLRDDGVPPAAIRLALLGHHYRADWQWTPRDLELAEDRLRLWRSAVGAGVPGGGGSGAAAGPGAAGAPGSDTSVQDVAQAVRRRLADDLDAPGALAVVDEWAVAASRARDADSEVGGQIRVVLDTLLGVDVS